MAGGGQVGERGREQLPHFLLGLLGVTDLAHEIADQGFGDGAAQ